MIIKFTPPAKSVSLSSWKIAAIRKNMICIETVTIALIAKWSTSRMCTAIANSGIQRCAIRQPNFTKSTCPIRRSAPPTHTWSDANFGQLPVFSFPVPKLVQGRSSPHTHYPLQRLAPSTRIFHPWFRLASLFPWHEPTWTSINGSIWHGQHQYRRRFRMHFRFFSFLLLSRHDLALAQFNLWASNRVYIAYLYLSEYWRCAVNRGDLFYFYFIFLLCYSERGKFGGKHKKKLS